MENKVFRESFDIATDLLIEPLDRNAVKGCEVSIEDDGLSAEADDGVLWSNAYGLCAHAFLF